MSAKHKPCAACDIAAYLQLVNPELGADDDEEYGDEEDDR